MRTKKSIGQRIRNFFFGPKKPFEYPPHIAVGRRVRYAGNNTSELVKKAIKLYDERIASIELAEKKH